MKNLQAFADVEKFRGILIPEELKNFVAEHNAATPSRHHFMVGATERVFGAVLSFEKNETEADTVYPALEAVEDKNLLPFAIDPFGNYICYQLNEKQIVYWDHENDAVTTTGKSLKEFIESLYYNPGRLHIQYKYHFTERRVLVLWWTTLTLENASVPAALQKA